MSIEEAQFRQRVDSTLRNLMRQLDAIDTQEEMDIKISDGVLQVDFEKGGTFVLSQQVPVREMWLSAQRRAWHFRMADGWVERDTGQELSAVLAERFSQVLGRVVHLRPPGP